MICATQELSESSFSHNSNVIQSTLPCSVFKGFFKMEDAPEEKVHLDLVYLLVSDQFGAALCSLSLIVFLLKEGVSLRINLQGLFNTPNRQSLNGGAVTSVWINRL